MSVNSSAGDSKSIFDVDEHSELKNEVMQLFNSALETHQNESQIARHVKVHIENKYGPTWHCIVGNDFKASVTHEAKHFMFFSVGKVAICLYKL